VGRFLGSFSDSQRAIRNFCQNFARWSDQCSMNETNEPSQSRPNFWKRLPGWARGGAIFVLGALIGAAIASPDQSKIDKANQITAKEQAIYAAAYVKRDRANSEYEDLNGQLDDVRSEIADQNATARADQRAQSKKLAKLKSKVSGARKTIAKRSFSGEGTYRVGKDVEPGTYKAAASSGCYWARLGSGDTSDIIDNNNADGPVLLTIEPGDFAIEVTRCSTFHKQ
jgi:hypothetical protein